MGLGFAVGPYNYLGNFEVTLELDIQDKRCRIMTLKLPLWDVPLYLTVLFSTNTKTGAYNPSQDNLQTQLNTDDYNYFKIIK